MGCELTLTGLTQPYVCACPKSWPEFLTTYSIGVFFALQLEIQIAEVEGWDIPLTGLTTPVLFLSLLGVVHFLRGDVVVRFIDIGKLLTISV